MGLFESDDVVSHDDVIYNYLMYCAFLLMGYR